MISAYWLLLLIPILFITYVIGKYNGIQTIGKLQQKLKEAKFLEEEMDSVISKIKNKKDN